MSLKKKTIKKVSIEPKIWKFLFLRRKRKKKNPDFICFPKSKKIHCFLNLFLINLYILKLRTLYYNEILSWRNGNSSLSVLLGLK